MKRKLLLFFVGLFFVPALLLAQEKTITGRVTAETDKSPLPGVSVKIKETNQGVTTNDIGSYSISAQIGQTLVFSYIGSNTKELIVGQENVINVQLELNETTLNEVVVVGFGKQKRANLTGAVSTVDVQKTFETRPITDPVRALQGTVPGLTITTPSGDLGTNPTIRLRGARGSINTGSTGAQPLILVDNVEVPSLQMINPNDIASVSVLKDAASTSIYGTRAAWGVILITTKSGSRDTPSRITYTNNIALQKPTKTPKIADAAAGARMALDAALRRNPSQPFYSSLGVRFDELAIQKMQEWENQYGGQDLGPEMVEGRDFEVRDGALFFYRPWDAPGMYMKDFTPQQNHNLSINGGSDKINYNMGFGYLNQDGILKVNPDQYDRYNLNLAVNASVNKWLDVRTKVLYSNSTLTKPYSYNGDTYDPWFYLYRWPKTFPYGTYQGQPFRNAITDVEQANMTSTKSNMTRLTIGGTAKILPGLTMDADYTYTKLNDLEHIVGGSAKGWNYWNGNPMTLETYTTPAHDRVRKNSSWEDRHVFNAYGNYAKEYGDHAFKALLGTNLEVFQNGNHFSQQMGLMDPSKGEFGLATGAQTVGGRVRHWSTLGYFGRINYSFQNKFLLELNGRYDGSSRFPVNDKWAFFSSLSAGYILSQEKFMEFAKPYLSFLKIRGSYGSVGNQNVGENVFLPVMPAYSTSDLAGQWLIGDAFMPTFQNPRAVSETLTWERVTTTDFGLDANFFNDKVNLSFDWYNRTVSDMLSAGLTLPSSFGATAPVLNAGKMQTKGWELTIGYNHTFSNGLNISATGQLSDFTEKVTEFPGNSTKIFTQTIASSPVYKGQVSGEIWGYVTDRFFTRNDFQQDANGNLLTDERGRYILIDGIPSQRRFEGTSPWFFYGPGDIKYKDLNGDGVITDGENTVGNPGDQKVIGNSTPRWQYGYRMDFSYKGFDFGFFLQGVGKRDLWAAGTMGIPGFRAAEGWYQHQLDYWTPENPNAFYPRPTDHEQNRSNKNFLVQTKYLLDMSYLRVKNLTFGYSLPQKLISKAKIQNLRIFFSGENLFELIDNVDIPIDPETDYTSLGLNDPNSFGRVYPYRRTYSLGVQLTL